jgi:maltooligosyltrehalose trehalohydrolase
MAMNYNFPLAGAFYEGSNTCSFVVWAPLHKQMDVVINDAIHPLEKDEMGYWKSKIKNIKPGSAYRFRINEDQLLPDPASISQREGVHGPSFVVDRKFDWTDGSWKGIPLGDMIIYELHVGTFTSNGTFEGVITKLPYLKALGVNAIELMPIAQFPGERNWGYDGVYTFAVQHSYGGVQGLKKLVDEAHRQGIAIILDVVYNHQGPEGNYLGAFAPYFTDKYKTFWGSAINYDDAWCDGVRNFYWQNALMWLDEFHIDGLRLDAVHAIWDNSASHFIGELKSKVSALEKESGRKKVLIAEFDLNNPRYINPAEHGGYGLDGQWIDEFHHALHAVITGETDGYYEDFGGIADLAKAFKDSYVYTGQFSIHRKKHFGVMPKDNPYTQFVVFSQNHDQVGNRLLGDRLTEKLSFEKLKLAAAVYLLSPHVPMLFMGEEYAEKNPFQYFISHTDENLVKMVREGRKKEFSYFKWKGEVPDPQSEKTFNACVLSWNHDQDAQAGKMLAYYRHLISWRKTRPALRGTTRDTLRVSALSDDQLIRVERKFNGDEVTLVFNFNGAPVSFSSTQSKIFDSSADEWNGPGANPDRDKNNFLLNPYSVTIFEKQK